MGLRVEDKIEYSKQSYTAIKAKIKYINKIINNSTDINEKIKALQEKYILERDLEKQRSYLKVVVDNSSSTDNSESKTIKLSDLISNNFYDYFKSTQPYKILKGGRSSLKSSAVSIKLVTKFLSDDNANVICFRKVAKYLSTSIYEQIKWAIYMLKAEDEFTFLKSPLRIEHNRTGTAFYFYGVDDPQKIKSAKIAKGYVSDLWFEEAAEFDGKEEIDTVTDTFIRQELPDGKSVEVVFTYNPPRNPYVWINEWIEEVQSDSSYLVHHSTYEQDSKGFLSKQFLDKVLKVKETDPDYHDWMYLGKVIGLGDTVYNYKLFQQIYELPDDDKILFADIAIDSGYSVSSTTFLYIAYTLKGNVILLDTYYYTPANKVMKKAPSDFSKDLDKFIKKNNELYKLNIDTRVIDSAEGALRNQVMKDYGLYLKPAKKKQKVKMIENVEDLLVQNRVFVLMSNPNNKIFIEEHKKYQWDVDTVESADPKVIKENDHTCDAFQYYVNTNLSKLNLKA